MFRVGVVLFRCNAIMSARPLNIVQGFALAPFLILSRPASYYDPILLSDQVEGG